MRLSLGKTAFITSAGPSFGQMDVHWIPDGDMRIRVAISGSIKAWTLAGIKPELWAVSDEPIVDEYAQYVPPGTPILAMQQAGALLTRKPTILPTCPRITVETMSDAKEYDNHYQIFSRGTLAIGTLLALKRCGVRRAFVFGLDCCRTRALYHYDGRPHPNRQEQFMKSSRYVKEKDVYVTPLLQRMIDQLNKANAAHLFDGIRVTVVGTPTMQTVFPTWSVQEFTERLANNDLGEI